MKKMILSLAKSRSKFLALLLVLEIVILSILKSGFLQSKKSD